MEHEEPRPTASTSIHYDASVTDPALDDPVPGEPIHTQPGIVEPPGAPISTVRLRDTRPPFREPPEPPTAFGASSVGGAVAAAALAGPDRTEMDDPRSDTTVADGDGMVDEGRREFPE